MKILFLCTSNKDRSPALEQFFRDNYPEHKYRSAGVNRYFTSQNKTHYLTENDIEWAELIVYAEDIHYTVVDRDFRENIRTGLKKNLILNLGEYKQGHLEEDYLLKAEEILKKHII